MTGLILIGLVPFAALGIMIGHMLTPDSIGPAMGGGISLLALLGGVWFPLGGITVSCPNWRSSYRPTGSFRRATSRSADTRGRRRLDRDGRWTSCSALLPRAPTAATRDGCKAGGPPDAGLCTTVSTNVGSSR